MSNVNAETNTNTLKIYRYKFDDNIVDEMTRFAKIHGHDDRVTFKEAWELWKDEHRPLIERENYRLTQHGFTGDIYKKIYKSVRYYYSKKSNKEVEPQKRREYISITKEILEKMDKHIATNYTNNDFKPSNAFTNFNDEHNILIETELANIMTNYTISKEDVMMKFKKTYKNRYFIYRKNL